ncbi:MAG: TolC family protein [Candidatus Krumholzibacteriota bacterium]|nr:TolC family protein [Candidatus Krumholzibacteriota bacterium]
MKKILFTKSLRVFLLAGAFIIPLISHNLRAAQTLTLEKALEISMEKSPSIRQSRLNLKRSRASLDAARARLKSKFSLSLTPLNYSNNRNFDDFSSTWYTRETKQSSGQFTIEQPIKWTDGTLSLINRFSWRESYSSQVDKTDRTYTNDFYINFQQPIFTYNRTKLELENLELDLERNRLQYIIQRLSLEKQVTEYFFNIYQTKKSLEIAEEDFKNKTGSYNIMKNKVKAGIGKKEDLYQAELNMAKSKSDLQDRRVQLEDALDNFKKLLGISIYDEISIAADVSYMPLEIDLKKAIDHGIKNRMEIRQSKIDIRNAENDLIETSANNEFKGNIDLSYGSTGMDEEFSNLYDSPDKDQQFRVTLEVPLWDWGEKESMIEASKATIDSRKLDLENEKKDIMIGIRETYRNLRNQVTQIEIADQNVRLSKLTYEINLERFKNGDLTSKDLNDYQNQLSREKNSKISALIQYKLYILEMKIKSLWDFENNCSVLDQMQ